MIGIVSIYVSLVKGAFSVVKHVRQELIGIYRIVNKITGHSYVGQSVNIERKCKIYYGY